MIEIRLHGRGGQGTVTAAELIAEAAFYDGKFAQAFPSFGIERRGAPVEAYARISDKPILLRSQIYEPDFLIIQDSTLIGATNLFRGIKKNTFVIINTEKQPKELRGFSSPDKGRRGGVHLSSPDKGRLGGVRIQTVPATQIALKILGKPIINTILLGAFAGACGLINPLSLRKAISARFKGDIAQKNLKAMNTAFCHCNPKDKYCFTAERCKIALDGGQRFAVQC